MASQVNKISEERVKAIKTFPSLVKFLHEELDWPVGQDSFSEEDIAFDFSPEEIGIQDKFATKVRTIKQIRPLEYQQPWGVFWIDFEPKHLPIGALRKILNAFVHKKRSKRSDQKTWATDDLLFIAGTGEDGHRGTTFAHFHKSDDGIEELKEFSWAEGETHFYYILDYLESLKWPGKDIAPDQWRAQWRSAFKGSTRRSIKTAEQLAFYMAELACDMRRRVNDAFEVESEKGPLHEMYNMFKKILIHDLEKDAFADMYAQTVTYGLFSARCMDTDGHFELHEVVDRIPETNPFLKGLFQACFKTVKKSKDSLDLDELGVMRLVELLDDLNQKDGSDRMQDILREFGRQTRGEDPVIHFYEGFLNAYESEQRKRRGVYYTPDPVVSYIVRSVDEILRKEFKLELGLADTSTWDEMVAKGTIKRPEGMHQSSKEWKELSGKPFVQILDPATGTGTFLKHTILLIYRSLAEKWKKEGCSHEKIDQLWNDYVPKHLLSRIYGFELMMAPYAVCHMKLGLVLKETGYKFKDNHRLQVFLTNALEPPNAEAGLPLFDAYLADEVRNANAAKSFKRFSVVIGNPPYAGVSSNHGEWITRLIDIYRFVDGQPLEEKKVWLKNDYVKFLRLSQNIVDSAGQGIVGIITDHSYLDSPTFRGLRNSMLRSFSNIHIVNLHGNSKRRECTPAGGADENVFDITQGVAIGFYVRGGCSDSGVDYFDVWGERSQKYDQLVHSSVSTMKCTVIVPKPAFYSFVPVSESAAKEYSLGWLISDIFSLGSNGVQTSRDSLVLAASRKDLTDRFNWIRSNQVTDAEICKVCGVEDKSFWSLAKSRKVLKGDQEWASRIIEYTYRPLDNCWLYASPNFVHRLRREVMQHMEHANLALCVGRAGLVVGGEWNLVFATKTICDHNLFYRGSSLNLPLYQYHGQDDLVAKQGRSHNIGYQFSMELARVLKKNFNCDSNLPDGITPENVFHYAYGILHSPCYRGRFSEFLKVDFPRLPLPSSCEFFFDVVKLGEVLVGLHLMESTMLNKELAIWSGKSLPCEVEKVSYVDKTVWINKEESVGFVGVPEDVFSFHIGGYQVCEKWLKDRKGRKLSKDDIEHYQKIVVALSETIRLMAEIDKVIDAHGGWPAAFTSKT